MADHSLESLLQINKDGIRNKPKLEIEIAETLCKKNTQMIYKDPIISCFLGKQAKKFCIKAWVKQGQTEVSLFKQIET